MKMYWLTRLDTIQNLFLAILIIGIILLVFYYIQMISLYDCSDEKEYTDFIRKSRVSKISMFITILISVSVLTFLPSKDDMIYIFVGGKTINFVQSDTSINKLPAQTTKMISNYLDRKIKDLK
jgi:uncharacterized membrane protein YesL